MLSSANIIHVIKLGRMRWAGHILYIWGEKVYTQDFGGERDHLEDPDRDERIWPYIYIYIWQHISHLLQGARKFRLTTHTNRFKAAAAAS